MRLLNLNLVQLCKCFLQKGVVFKFLKSIFFFVKMFDVVVKLVLFHAFWKFIFGCLGRPNYIISISIFYVTIFGVVFIVIVYSLNIRFPYIMKDGLLILTQSYDENKANTPKITYST